MRRPERTEPFTTAPEQTSAARQFGLLSAALLSGDCLAYKAGRSCPGLTVIDLHACAMFEVIERTKTIPSHLLPIFQTLMSTVPGINLMHVVLEVSPHYSVDFFVQRSAAQPVASNDATHPSAAAPNGPR
ncbi:MAG: hypothetical protein A3F13_09330 [Gammaproteobacteria bacterium RIFCSPHIGHO2_12_FULL_40_19]|nr:MAG: hypothetical protein A3F13_09330 [Gammaproteobacteria bacterium RIFCSPHIGHO2_12_FULL_40_19]